MGSEVVLGGGDGGKGGKEIIGEKVFYRRGRGDRGEGFFVTSLRSWRALRFFMLFWVSGSAGAAGAHLCGRTVEGGGTSVGDVFSLP